jgi:hypothetical protein
MSTTTVDATKAVQAMSTTTVDAAKPDQTSSTIDAAHATDTFHSGKGATACAREYIQKGPACMWLPPTEID